MPCGALTCARKPMGAVPHRRCSAQLLAASDGSHTASPHLDNCQTTSAASAASRRLGVLRAPTCCVARPPVRRARRAPGPTSLRMPAYASVRQRMPTTVPFSQSRCTPPRTSTPASPPPPQNEADAAPRPGQRAADAPPNSTRSSKRTHRALTAHSPRSHRALTAHLTTFSPRMHRALTAARRRCHGREGSSTRPSLDGRH